MQHNPERCRLWWDIIRRASLIAEGGLFKDLHAQNKEHWNKLPYVTDLQKLCGFSYMVKIKMQLRDADPGPIATLHKRQVWLYTIGIHLSADRPSIAT